MKKYLLLILLLATLMGAGVVAAAPPPQTAGQTYQVQADDSLSTIATRFYGRGSAYLAIVEATNARAAEDDTFSPISDPNVLRIGQKLWIPAEVDGAQALTATTPSDAETSLETTTAQVDVPAGAFAPALQNATYNLTFFEDPLQLTDGRFEDQAAQVVVTLSDLQAFGDLDGDGVADAAAILVSNTSGSGTFYDLVVVLDQAGIPVNVATVFLGDRTRIEKFFIEGDQIAIDYVTQGPDDPFCCPTLHLSRRYQLRAGVLYNLDGEVTASQLANMTYRLQYPPDGTVELQNGVFSEPVVPGSAAEIVVSLVNASTSGDLDGDGLRDGAAVLASSTGGSGTFYDLAVVVVRDGEALHLATQFLGDRIELQSVFIDANGRVIVDMITQGPDDPLCCPSQDTTQVFELQGTELVDVTVAPSGDTSATPEPIDAMPEEAPTPTAGRGVTLETARNATYQGIYQEPIQLSDGSYEGEPFVPGGASRPTVTFIEPFNAFGDLNGDGVQDGAVFLAENSGGSGTFVYLAALVDQDGLAVNSGTQILGDRVQLEAVSLNDGLIMIDLVTQGPNDPFCCPSLADTISYRLVDGALVEQTDFSGVYTATLPAAASPGRAIVLTLGEDGSVELSTDYLTGDPPIVQTGAWENNNNGAIRVSLTGQDGRTYDQPEVLFFNLVDGQLIATLYDRSRYGSEGLTLQRQ